MSWNAVLVIHRDRVLGIEIQNAMILDEHTRRTISRCRNNETFIKTDLQRAGFDFYIPIRLFVTQPEMPFADDASVVAGFLQQRRDSNASGFDAQGRIPGK